MTTYRLKAGDKLVFSADQGEWEEIEFKAADFTAIGAATADEVAAVVKTSKTLTATVEDGRLVLATKTKGGHATLDIDLAVSKAAAPLGLTGRQAVARGDGVQAATLLGQKAAPYALAADAQMTVVVDATPILVVFAAADITAGAAPVKQVVDVINAKVANLARAATAGRVLLTSPTLGPGSRLEVLPGHVDAGGVATGKPDAAAALGFVGAAAVSQPHEVFPARLVCDGRRPALRLLNLTAAPLEVHFPSGSVLLPARGALPISSGDAGHEPLRRLVKQGAVQLISVPES